MKRVLCVLLLAATLLGGFCLAAGAEKSAPKIALDREQILAEFNGRTPTAEELETLRLAEYYEIRYTLDKVSGELDIFCGTDENGNKIEQQMLPYVRNTWIPWQNNDDYTYIKTARIHEGVQSIGRYSFYMCENLETAYIPHSVRKINVTTFYQCADLQTVYYAGTEQDFRVRVKVEETRNWYGVDADGNNTVDEDEVVFKLTDKIHFGESVSVFCKNEEGDVITSYTVGGYFPGDEYVITPKELTGLTYVGEQTEIKGTFKENDKSSFVFTYHCDHEYAVKDPSMPCGSFCTKCGRVDPNPPVEHTWGETEVRSERGFLTPLDQSVTCKVCQAKVEEYAYPYAPYICAAVAAPILITGIVFAIVIPIRKKKKLKEMTW